MSYTVPAQTRIGHVHLKVSDLDKALAFYQELLGFELVMKYGTQAAFISAGGYQHRKQHRVYTIRLSSILPVKTWQRFYKD
jgi:catechol-2,3-dioxygenase